MNTMTINASQPVSKGYRVDISRGENIGRVSSEWFSRPGDERYLSLTELYDAVKGRADRAKARTVESRAVRVEANRDNAERLSLIVPGQEQPIAPTHWSFGQLCSLVGTPARYLRELPAPLAGINMQHGLLSHRAERVKTLETEDGRVELRAVTGPDYGRIWDHELVAAVMKIAGNGIGDTMWKVPGVLDWATMTHNPFVDITKDTTTLYASDRDVFLFLVDDTPPIKAGRLPNGEAALESFLSPDSADMQEAAFTRRLDRLSRHASRIERDLRISTETLGLFVRFWLTITPPIRPEDHASAQIKGCERFEGFVETLGQHLQKGQSFLAEIPDDQEPDNTSTPRKDSA